MPSEASFTGKGSDDDRSMRSGHIPAPAVRRLSLYLRELERFQAEGRQTISSKQLGLPLGLTDAQVRKDLACFGQFGHPGVGYRAEEMIHRIRRILGTDRTWKTLVVGAGNLGQALVSYRGFIRKSFDIVAIFDHDPRKIGMSIGIPPGLKVLAREAIRSMVIQQGIAIGILCVPADAAQRTADLLVEAGVKGILNFAPVAVSVPAGISLASVDLAVHLEQLAFHISASQISLQKTLPGL